MEPKEFGMSKAIQLFRAATTVSAVVATAHREDLHFLRTLFDEAGWNLIEAESCVEALAVLKLGRVDLVISDRDLGGGGWRLLLRAAAEMPSAPPLIVTSRLADECLWAEVLNEGGYDILVQPFEREEVVRVISAATRHGRNQESRRRVAAPKFLTASN